MIFESLIPINWPTFIIVILVPLSNKAVVLVPITSFKKSLSSIKYGCFAHFLFQHNPEYLKI